jgi:ParB family transcriptional regulator, chromosome partitioning protein
MSAQPIETAAEPTHGAEITVPLNRLKASPRNARKVPHSPATIEAFAASIKAKGVLQPPVVEIERNAEGAPTGNYLVTIGEGRRQGLRLLLKRKQIKRTHPVRCIVDAENDGHEISLDENVTREAMHPADQFEAFKRLADEKGYGAEDIAARFGVTPQTVRQRLRLGAVAPELLTAYRDEALTLEQLMGFGVSDDQERQRQVFDQLGQDAGAYAIRRAMTEAKVEASDRRVRFIGAEAYEAAGGAILRDLFTEDGGGWFEDVPLLNRLVAEKLSALADEIREQEGWKWVEAYLDFPHEAALGRVYPEPVERSEADMAAIAALSEEYDRLVSETDSAEEFPPEVDARLTEIDKALQDFGPAQDYRPEDRARGGVIVHLRYDGDARVERGFIRPEDRLPDPAPEPEADAEPADAADGPADGPASGGEPAPEPDEGLAPLPERLVLDLTAHRSAGLRDALAADTTVALTLVVHAMALDVFYPPYQPTALQLRLTRTRLERYAPSIEASPAGRRLSEWKDGWRERLPHNAKDLWGALLSLSACDLLDLLALCAGAALSAVHDPSERRPGAWEHAEALATVLSLDMSRTWEATADSYFGRVSKARILEAVAEGVGQSEADRIAGLKKAEMAEAAERLMEGKGWLPPLLRTAPPEQAEGEAGDAAPEDAPDDDAYPFAAE